MLSNFFDDFFKHAAMPSILSSHTLPFHLNFQRSIEDGWNEMGLGVMIVLGDPGEPRKIVIW